MVSVGFSQNYDTRIAFYEAINQCDTNDAALIIVFAGARHLPNIILAAAESKLPDIPLFGGSVVGTISRDAAFYTGYEITVIVFSSGPDLPIVVSSDPCEFTDVMIGNSFGEAINKCECDTNSLIMFYTSVANVNNKELHYATTILQSLIHKLKNKKMQIVGGGLLTGFNFEDSWAIGGKKIHKHYAFGLLFPRHIELKTNILRACQPAGPTMTITGISGPRVTSIDNKPALDVICFLLDRKPGTNGNILGLNLCLGLVKNNNDNQNNLDKQINRVLVSERVSDRSICLLEPDFKVGDVVQLMIRDNDFMNENALIQDVDKSIFSIYVDCAGRASILTGSPEEEGVLAMSSLSRSTPAIGIYSGVEIASINNIPTVLDLTGVMISLLKT